ncbi:hypothetical protein V8G57_02495 [Collimonas sp. H4R21]|jgi:hypothetical protein|uniref:Uncharacterized protein n=1 Tax=Collimonas rhizosphaerae TaxID=3126357 RepID=A0ABU9PQH2_9BURK|nr:hypothetical protein [Collimonas sp. OK412]SFB69073.1 hypothetical protein SAMN04515619_10112 [Collimonas sp. OK412]
MSQEKNTVATAIFYRQVRDFVAKTPVWGMAIRYQTKPDERFDMTLISRRIYGRPDEFLVVMAAAGLDSVEQELPEQLLVLPTESQLLTLKTAARFGNFG